MKNYKCNEEKQFLFYEKKKYKRILTFKINNNKIIYFIIFILLIFFEYIFLYKVNYFILKNKSLKIKKDFIN